MFLLAVAALAAGDKRINLLPKLHPGQTITYLIRFQSDKTVKTESKVVAPMAPNAAQIDAHGLLRVEIRDVQQAGRKATIHARGRFLTLDSGVWLKRPGDKKPDWDKQRVDPSGKSIEFTISSDGSVNEVKGLDSLFPEQQVEKSTRGGEIRAFMSRPRARRPPGLKNNGAPTGNRPRLEQARKLTRMIDMQVGQKNDVSVRQR